MITHIKFRWNMLSSAISRTHHRPISRTHHRPNLNEFCTYRMVLTSLKVAAMKMLRGPNCSPGFGCHLWPGQLGWAWNSLPSINIWAGRRDMTPTSLHLRILCPLLINPLKLTVTSICQFLLQRFHHWSFYAFIFR